MTRAHPALSSAIALLVSTAGVCAQATWIVDAANGPGTHYRDLPPAFGRAKHGDTILVRPGSYSGGILTNQGVTVIGDRATITVRDVSAGPALRVNAVPVGRSFRMTGVSITTWGSVGLDLISNQGQVHVAGGDLSGQLGVSVVNCGYVTLHGVNVARGAVISQSNVAAVGCVFAGDGADSDPVVQPTPGIAAQLSTLSLTGCTSRGGRAFNNVANQVALQFSACDVDVLATFRGNGPYRAGDKTPTTVWTPAIHGVTGTLWLDPAVRLAPTFGPNLGGSFKTRTTSPASLDVWGREHSIGQFLDLHALADSGDLAVLFFSGPGTAIRTPFGYLWLAPAPLVPLAGTAIGSGNQWAIRIPVPNDSQLRGVAGGFQMLAGTLARGFRFSNPATVVLR